MPPNYMTPDNDDDEEDEDYMPMVKCSGPPAPCDKCQRLQLDCGFVVVSPRTQENTSQAQLTVPSETHTEAGTIRQRALVACQECRSRKARCSGQRPKCHRCSVWALPCVYESGTLRNSTRRRRSQAQGSGGHHTTLAAPESVSPDPATERLFLARDVVTRHIEAYFEYLYPLPGYDFFHRPSLLEDFNNDKIPAVLSSAICAAASTYIAHSKETRQVSVQWTKDLDNFIFSNLNSLHVLNLQLMVLSIFQHYAYRQFGRVWLMHGLATRLALSLQLNKPKPSNPDNFTIVRRECIRRLVWGLFIHDKIHSGGVEEFAGIPARWMLISLPANENNFQSEIEIPMGTLESPAIEALDIGGYVTILHKLRYEIISTTKAVITRSTVFLAYEVEEMLSFLSQLRSQLSAFYDTLPRYLQLSDRNTFSRSSKPSLTAYIALHTWYFQASCDLFRIFLPGSARESASADLLERIPWEFVRQWRCLCVSFAVTMAKMWKHFLEMKQSRILKSPGDLLHLSPESCVSVHQCTKILLIARSYQLYSGIVDPLTNDSISLNDQLIDELCQSNVAFLERLASIIPIVAVVQKDVREMLLQGKNEPKKDYVPKLRPPVTSHVQRDKALSRYNPLAMGISASVEPQNSDGPPPSPRAGVTRFEDDRPTSLPQEKQPGITSECQWEAVADLQPHEQRQNIIINNRENLQPVTDFSATLWGDCSLSTAAPGIELFPDYSVPASEFDMSGELDMFFVNMPLQDRCV